MQGWQRGRTGENPIPVRLGKTEDHDRYLQDKRGADRMSIMHLASQEDSGLEFRFLFTVSYFHLAARLSWRLIDIRTGLEDSGSRILH